MLHRLRAGELGVIAALDVTLQDGLTVITGETGAGKTLIVGALDLLCGGKPDVAMVRAGADEAVVEAVFFDDEGEHLVRRVIPRSGRSRAEIDGNFATVAMLEQFAGDLVDLHGQHAHQSLLRPNVQRGALDHFAGVDLSLVEALRGERKEIDAGLSRLGGDDATRARELDLLLFEVAEIDAAAIASDDEIERLAEEESILAATASLRDATQHAADLLEGTSINGAVDLLGEAIAQLDVHSSLGEFDQRLRAAQVELVDAASEIRRASENFEEDPERQAAVRERQELLRRLVRKHGSSLSDVTAFSATAHRRIDELTASDEQRALLVAEREAITQKLHLAEKAVGDRRRAAASELAAAVQSNLRDLAMPKATIVVQVGDDVIGDQVEFQLAPNVGEPPAPLAKVASGGELALAMLALRLVLSSGPSTLIFDEVDAGIGGEAALFVGRALAALGKDHQVIVVTHLAQVAAYATTHIVVEKDEHDGRTVAHATVVSGRSRVVELARMLSGQPDSESALAHASDLLANVQEAPSSGVSVR